MDQSGGWYIWIDFKLKLEPCYDLVNSHLPCTPMQHDTISVEVTHDRILSDSFMCINDIIIVTSIDLIISSQLLRIKVKVEVLYGG